MYDVYVYICIYMYMLYIHTHRYKERTIKKCITSRLDTERFNKSNIKSINSSKRSSDTSKFLKIVRTLNRYGI